jgi:predicted DNA-binding protein (MmcQ/YjbR family)
VIPLQALVDYCAAKEGASIRFPFGDVPVCFARNGRIFAEIYPGGENYRVTLRCEPAEGEALRGAYPGIVVPGYHVPLRQRKHKITVYLNRGLPDSAVLGMVDASYRTLDAKDPRLGEAASSGEVGGGT